MQPFSCFSDDLLGNILLWIVWISLELQFPDCEAIQKVILRT